MNRNTLLAVLLASAASFGATWAQPAAPSLADACQHYATAMEAVRSPHVPFPVVAGAVERTKGAAEACAAKKGDAAAVQDAANDAAVAAAPYAQQGTRP